MEQKEVSQKKKKAPLMSLLINIVIPSLILSKLSDDEHLGATLGLVVALAFPVIYGIVDFAKEKKVNIISTLGLVNVLLTGTIGLFEMDKEWIAIKEASIPAIIGIVVFISNFTKYPLVEKLLYNEDLLNVSKIESQLKFRQTKEAFQKRLKNTSFMLVASFFLSAILNFALAKYLIQSETGTPEFNNEIGKMTAWSFVVIALPSTIVMMGALMYLIRGVKKYTGFEMQEVLVGFEEDDSIKIKKKGI